MSLVLRSGQHPRLALLDLPDDVLDMIILFVYSLSSSPGSLDHSTTCIPHTSGFASSCRRIREICLPRLIRHLRFTGGSSLGQDSIEARLRCIAKSKAFAESLLADPHQTAMVRGIRIDQWDVPRGQLPFEHILKEEMREALVVLARLMCSLPNLTEISVFLGYIWEVLHEPLLTVIQGCQTVRGLEVVQGICRTAGDLASLDFLNDVTAPLSELSVFGYRATHEDLEYGGSQASFLVADKPSLLEHLPGHLVKTLKTFIASDLAIYVPPGHSPMVYAAVTALELSCCDVEPGSIFVLFPHLQTLHLDNVVCFEEQYGHLRTAEDAAALEIVKSDPVWPTLQHMRVDLVELLRLGWAFPRTTSLSLHMSMKFGRHDEGAEARHVRELLRATQPTLLSLRADKRYVWYLAKSLRPVDGANVRILSLHAWFGSSQNVRGNSEEVSTMVSDIEPGLTLVLTIKPPGSRPLARSSPASQTSNGWRCGCHTSEPTKLSLTGPPLRPDSSRSALQVVAS
jgi:hypothetical protein